MQNQTASKLCPLTFKALTCKIKYTEQRKSRKLSVGHQFSVHLIFWTFSVFYILCSCFACVIFFYTYGLSILEGAWELRILLPKTASLLLLFIWQQGTWKVKKKIKKSLNTWLRLSLIFPWFCALFVHVKSPLYYNPVLHKSYTGKRYRTKKKKLWAKTIAQERGGSCT